MSSSAPHGMQECSNMQVQRQLMCDDNMMRRSWVQNLIIAMYHTLHFAHTTARGAGSRKRLISRRQPHSRHWQRRCKGNVAHQNKAFGPCGFSRGHQPATRHASPAPCWKWGAHSCNKLAQVRLAVAPAAVMRPFRCDVHTCSAACCILSWPSSCSCCCSCPVAAGNGVQLCSLCCSSSTSHTSSSTWRCRDANFAFFAYFLWDVGCSTFMRTTPSYPCWRCKQILGYCKL